VPSCNDHRRRGRHSSHWPRRRNICQRTQITTWHGPAAAKERIWMDHGTSIAVAQPSVAALVWSVVVASGLSKRTSITPAAWG